jgi:hypothetical protein
MQEVVYLLQYYGPSLRWLYLKFITESGLGVESQLAARIVLT